jgi:hypothetical protein
MGVVHNSTNKVKNLRHTIMKNEFKDIKKHNIMIVVDSHSRDCNKYRRISRQIEVYGLVKLGASVVDMVAQPSSNYMLRTKNDVVVLQGGSSDVYCNNAKAALLQIMKFREVTNSTNIVVLDIPHRYDLG